MLKKNTQTGFTLIELLVVIAVIGILASVILASLNSARKKAADAKIKSELKQISTALEFYYDSYGSYVVAGGGYGGGNYSSGGGFVTLEDSGGNYTKSITNRLAELGFLGTGFKNEANYMVYVCFDAYGMQRYALSATLNNPSAADIANIQTTCNGTGSNGTYSHYGKNYAISN
ncbi:MAG TPA: type II secretion system protein [Candidatus Paceibacterota bacterium]